MNPPKSTLRRIANALTLRRKGTTDTHSEDSQITLDTLIAFLKKSHVTKESYKSAKSQIEKILLTLPSDSIEHHVLSAFIGSGVSLSTDIFKNLIEDLDRNEFVCAVYGGDSPPPTRPPI